MDRNDTTNGEQSESCWKCGMTIEADTRFCVNCGALVADMPTEPESEPPTEAEPEPPTEQEPEAPAEAEPEQPTEPELEQPTELEPEQPTEPELEQPTEPEPEQPTEPEPEQPTEPEAVPIVPMYQAAPVSDMPFPDAPSHAETMGFRKEVPVKSGNVFVDGALGFIIFAALIVAIIIVGIFSTNFLAYTNLNNIFTQFLMFGALACGVAMTSRAKGPDLSMGAVVALAGVIIAAMGGAWIIGLVLAFLVCTSIGAINGILIVFLRIPSLITTIVIASIARGVVYVLTNGREIRIVDEIRMLSRLEVSGIPIIPLAIFAVAFVVAFVVVLFSRLGKPLSKREVKDNRSASYFVAYLFSAIIAFFVGAFFVARVGAASPIIGLRYEIFIILCFAVITSSKYLDNRGIPVVFAIVVALYYTLMSNVYNLIGVSPYWHQLAVGVIALVFVIVSYIARRDSLKGLVHRV